MSSTSSIPKRQSLSTIESSVTRLLVATKKLLESLTHWAKHIATETDVSDSYVSLGNEFKVACRSFSNAGVDVSDLGDVPHSLRLVLEEALCEEASQESLDKFLPKIREIIVSLLQNLKQKQALAKELQLQAQASTSQSSIRSVSGPATAPTSSTSSVTGTPKISEPKISGVTQRPERTVASPVISSPSNFSSAKQSPKDALSALQNGDQLRRRASKRFSAYQYAKLANFTPDRDAELPGKIENFTEKTPTKSPLLGVPAKSNSENDDGFAPADDIETIDSLQVYLKIGSKVKKVKLSGSLSTASLRLLFVEKFAYSPGSESFPEMYIQDPNSSVFYELENLGDIQDQCVISLQEAEIENAAFKSLDSKINLLTTQLSEMQKSFGEYLSKASTHKETTPSPPVPIIEPPLKKSALTGESPVKKVSLKELSEIKRDLAAIRQLSSTNKSSFESSIHGIAEQIKTFKDTGYNASESSNRAYMETCRSKLSKECEGLLTKTDDLQDIIEAIRKDVAQRRARPDKKQLNFVSKELEVSKAQLDAVNDYIVLEKQNWKKIWETELNTVCEEQQFFNLQEELVMDLQDDLSRAFETFHLVEECSEQFSKNPNLKILPNLAVPNPGESITNIRDALLSEVVALNPNHEDRVAAIERAERLREMQKELAISDNFQDELGGFVEGKKLKKSGGIEETERLRELQNRENLGFLD